MDKDDWQTVCLCLFCSLYTIFIWWNSEAAIWKYSMKRVCWKILQNSQENMWSLQLSCIFWEHLFCRTYANDCFLNIKNCNVGKLKYLLKTDPVQSLFPNGKTIMNHTEIIDFVLEYRKRRLFNSVILGISTLEA